MFWKIVFGKLLHSVYLPQSLADIEIFKKLLISMKVKIKLITFWFLCHTLNIRLSNINIFKHMVLPLDGLGGKYAVQRSVKFIELFHFCLAFLKHSIKTWDLLGISRLDDNLSNQNSILNSRKTGLYYV